MTNLSANYYYPDRRIKSQYSYTPVGYPDINYLIKSQPYWRLNKTVTELKKKTLILADWTNHCWSSSKTQAVKLKLNELLDTGFEIYIWEDNKFELLTKGKLKDINKLVIKPTLQNDIQTKATEQKKWLKESTYILDDYQLDCLIDEKVSEEPRRFYTTALVGPSVKDTRRITSIITYAQPQIEQFVQDEFSYAAIRLFQKVQQEFPEIQSICNFNSLQLMQDQAAELIENGSLTMDNVVFDKTQLFNIEALKFNNSLVTPDELNQILNQPERLKKLTFLACRYLVNGDLSSQNLSELEELGFYSCVIKNANLQALLANTPKLKRLTLGCRALSKTPPIEVNLPELEKIECTNGDLSSFKLRQLLLSNKLSSIKFSGCTTPQDQLDNDNDFGALREFDCLRSDFPVENLLKILAQAPNLQILKFGKCTSDLGAYTLSSLPGYLYLEELHIADSDISSVELQLLLTKAPNLKKLTLNFCDHLTEDFQKLYCNNLESLEISEYLSFHNLQVILSATPKLKNLSCYLCNTEWEKLIDTVSFATLETISLQECNITCEDLKRLIHAAPRLKKLDLVDCQDLELDEELDQLLRMRQLSLYAPKVSEPEFSALLSDTGEDNVSSTTVKSGIDSVAKVDADTRLDPDTNYNIDRIFYPIDSDVPLPPANYDRSDVFNTINVESTPCALHNAFTMIKSGAPEFTPVALKACSEDVFTLAKTLERPKDATLYYGKQELVLGQEWQALASLSPHEKMTHYHIEPHTPGVEIQYSLRDNQYYIRSKGTKKVAIDFLLKVPNQIPSLPLEISKMVEQYNHFGDGELKKDKEKPNGHDYLRYIQEQEKGACRHRVIAFKDWAEKAFPQIPVRIVDNSCHAFVEAWYQNQWIRCDLGGYPAQLTLNEKHKPQEIKEKPFVKLLETWNKQTLSFSSVDHYCQHLLQKGGIKKHLIELSDDRDVTALQLSLQNYCQHTSRPVYYVNSPNDLICSAAFIERQGIQGVLRQGPGGPLYDFLQANRNNSPVLIVNYAHFSADEIVRFNGLLDDIRHADGTLLPESTQILGLINSKKPGCYQGEDFYSRFDKVELCPLHPVLLQESAPSLDVKEKSQIPGASISINLYYAADWEERLLGRWVLHKDNLYFEEGELIKALASGLPIELQNAPWDDERFANFWLAAKIHKKIDHAGRTIKIPENLQLLRSEGYDWQNLAQQVEFTSGCQSNSSTLNSTCLSEFFNQYQCDNQSKTLDQIPGILESYSKKTLEVNLTSPLLEDEWAMLLTACQKHQVKLVCHVVPGLDLIPPLAHKLPANEALPNLVWQGDVSSTMAIASGDIDTTVAQLTKDSLDWQIIDVSECQSSDLLVSLEGNLNTERLNFDFHRREKALLDALAANQKVILKGTFSKELSDSLSSLLLRRQMSPQKDEGQLVLVGNDMSTFNYLNPLMHEVTTKEIEACLHQHFLEEELDCLTREQLETEPLSQLKARMYFHRDNPSQATDGAWQGVYSLPIAIELTDFDATHSKEKSDAFIAKRLHAVNQVFSHSPFVFLTGLTAVGKSTFVEKYLDDKDNTLYQGESKMLEWAKDISDTRKILFIDEANIENRQWSEFEGLFNKPPGILINGVYYPLTDKHKVVFAGNPLNYGGERQLAPFFARHGNAVLFEPMPQEFIYEEIIKPIFKGTKLEANTLAIAEPLLEVYRFLCEQSHDEVLISPREVQMMALLVLSAYEKGVSTDLELLAEHYAYQLGKTLVPEILEKTYKKKFEPKVSLLKSFSLESRFSKGASDFLVTPSRNIIHQQLEELLDLRELRQTTTNTAQKYGGINGIVLEGEPGIGKSELVIATLVAHGYKEAVLNPKDADKQSEKPAGKIFYRMPVSMQYEDKKRLILKAADEGAVLVVDEINSSPMMERLLNDILMNKMPGGRRPVVPGFLLIATQNPITMAGRTPMGNALARRLIKLVLSPYTSHEIQEILHKKGVKPVAASEMVDAYASCRLKAEKNHLTPAPTFRDLLRVAKNHLKALFKKDKTIVNQAEGVDINKENLTEPRLSKRFLRYKKLCERYSTDLEKACALLNAYTKSTRFIHWGQPHRKEIDSIIQQMDTEIKTTSDLLSYLERINLIENEPLAYCIQFIRENLLAPASENVVPIDRSQSVF
ncbi:DUF5617 domain-containing protein [Legionella brunensis]|uniref:AAA domain (Dynein-related subfamily) n=1 Tax=Legionella brunensis TaxID=29422 RepID=A0A0W0S5A4_9GAMM|nr:DUF5617 domain-containing protein [Legionella brunensis]KTC78265.1 AAA domain (dynein-related subfamily) [Legionella brunensis]